MLRQISHGVIEVIATILLQHLDLIFVKTGRLSKLKRVGIVRRMSSTGWRHVRMSFPQYPTTLARSLKLCTLSGLPCKYCMLLLKIIRSKLFEHMDLIRIKTLILGVFDGRGIIIAGYLKRIHWLVRMGLIIPSRIRRKF